MKLKKLCVQVTLLFVCLTATASADHGLGLAYLYGYGGIGQTRLRSYGPPPPYFALHPPVYYGQRFTRPYGVSPFATWPQVQAGPNYSASPHVNRVQTIINPYCPAPGMNSISVPMGDGGFVTTSEPASQSVEFDNPYYKPTIQYTAAPSETR